MDGHTSLSILASQIRIRLKQMGIPQKEVAKQLRLTKGRVSQILCGHGNMTLQTIRKVAAVAKLRLVIRLEPNE